MANVIKKELRLIAIMTELLKKKEENNNYIKEKKTSGSRDDVMVRKNVRTI